MGACASAPPNDAGNPPGTNVNGDGRTGINNNNVNNSNRNKLDLYKPISLHARSLEYPKTKNEIINNPYSLNDWIEIKEKISQRWVVATIIDKQNNWIRILSQSPNMQFTDKLHLIRDGSRIRQLGSGSNDNSDTPKDRQMSQFDKNLSKNGVKLIYEIKYDEEDSTIDTIYKSFEYQIFRNNDNEQLKQNIFEQFLSNQDNEEFLNENISDWSQCKNNNDLLTDNDHLIILSKYCKLNVISYQLNNDQSNDDINLQIILDHKYSENEDNNIIRLLYISKTKQYKLLSLTMDAITKLIQNNEIDNNNNDYTNWRVEQILQWLNLIEFGSFKDIKYDNLREGIQKLEIDGSNIIKMNDLTLKSLGIDDQFDQNLITTNIERLVEISSKNEEDESSQDKLNGNDIIEEEQDMNLLDGGYVTPGGGGGDGSGEQYGFGTNQSGKDNFEIPEEYLDPIHYTIMRDPVLSIVSGHTFERESITEWINQKGTDPINQKALNLNQLVPNRTLREAIDRFIKIYGSEYTETKR